MAKYQRKPLTVEAVEWTGNNFDIIKEFTNGEASIYNGCLFLTDKMPNRGDMVVKYPDNRISVLNYAAFSLLFDPVEEK